MKLKRQQQSVTHGLHIQTIVSHCEKAPQSHTKLKPHKPVTSTVSNFIRSYTAMRSKKYPQRNIVMTGKECKLCWQSSFPGKQPYKCSRDVLPERLKGRIGEITNVLGIFVLSTYHTTSLLMVLAHHSCNILNLKNSEAGHSFSADTASARARVLKTHLDQGAFQQFKHKNYSKLLQSLTNPGLD